MIVINFRQGIGVDIEYNEDICHLIDEGSDKVTLVGFSGIIILVPFIKIYIGTFDELGEAE